MWFRTKREKDKEMNLRVRVKVPAQSFHYRFYRLAKQIRNNVTAIQYKSYNLQSLVSSIYMHIHAYLMESSQQFWVRLAQFFTFPCFLNLAIALSWAKFLSLSLTPRFSNLTFFGWWCSVVVTMCQLQTLAWKSVICFPWSLLCLPLRGKNEYQLNCWPEEDETNGAEPPKPITLREKQSCLHCCSLEKSSSSVQPPSA